MSVKIKYSYNHKKITCYSFEIIKTVIIVFSLVSIIFTFFIRDANVVGNSMYETLHDSDKVFLTNFNYTPKSGDIVAINAENMIEKRIIKRVIATEGQTIKLDYENDRIIVDGVVLDEPYISDSTFAGNYGDYEIPEVVPEGKVFVMGDNRRVSLDSRRTEIGLIDVENVIGKAQFVAFPFSDFGYLYWFYNLIF